MKTPLPTPQVPLFRLNARGEVEFTVEGLKWFKAIYDDLKDHEERIVVLEP